MASDIETIRKYLGIEKWMIFGHSFGGMLASYYATKFPERISGMILSSSGGIDMELFKGFNPTERLEPWQRDSLRYWSGKIARGDTSYATKLHWANYLAPLYLYDRSFAPVIARRLTQGNSQVNGLVLQNMQKINFDCAKGLAGFTAPVLIIQGKEDIVPEQIALKAHQALKNSTLVFLEHCGHYGWLEQPEEYFKHVNKFLNALN